MKKYEDMSPDEKEKVKSRYSEFIVHQFLDRFCELKSFGATKDDVTFTS